MAHWGPLRRKETNKQTTMYGVRQFLYVVENNAFLHVYFI